MLLRCLALAFGVWLGGLLAFSHGLPRIAPPQGKTDAVVALTGGTGRLERALQDLRAGRARRLLISGVHKTTTKRDLRRRTGASRQLFDCCVDIGHAAGDTIGNAAEAAAWMDMKGYRSLRLVTSRTHMPRARLEFMHRLPDVTILPEPVDDDTSLAARIGEYNKYVTRLIWLRLDG